MRSKPHYPLIITGLTEGLLLGVGQPSMAAVFGIVALGVALMLRHNGSSATD